VTGVRWRPEGFEGRCEYCRDWFPIEPEFWDMARRSFRKCRACVREDERISQALKRLDPARIEADRQKSREYRATLRRYGLAHEYGHRWYMNNREKLCAERRERYRQQRLAAGKSYKPRGVDSLEYRSKARDYGDGKAA
jgi:hypothetical protein